MFRYLFALVICVSLAASCEAGYSNNVFYNAPKAVVRASVGVVRCLCNPCHCKNCPCKKGQKHKVR